MLWRNCFAFIFVSVQWAVALACKFQDWFIATCYFPFTGHSSISQVTLLYWHLFFCWRKILQNDTLSLLKQYLHNIKQITSGCQPIPASKRTSRRGRWPRIHQRRQDRWADCGKWLLVLIVFSLQIFRNRSAFAQERRDNVPISTGRRTVRKMNMHSDFTLAHMELCSNAFVQGKERF